MDYKAVIFDLDGTLLDTIDDLADSANDTLDTLGFAPHSVDKYKIYVGDGIEMLVKRALPEANRDEKTVKKAVELQRKSYASKWNNKTSPYEGVIDLLKELKQRGIKSSVFSNKPDDFTKMCVTEFLPVHLLDIVQGARTGVPRKPNPAGALEISGRLSILPEETVYVGDTNTDMQTAVSAGMLPVGVLWGFREEQELKDSGAARIISKPEELLELF
ncbi:MAG: HAD family hydrolase [Planctomycetota bacterium]|jgi:phosphoglycolate phosphatase